MTQQLIETASGPHFLLARTVDVIRRPDHTGRVTAGYVTLGQLQRLGLVCEDWLTEAGMAVYRSECPNAIEAAHAEAIRLDVQMAPDRQQVEMEREEDEREARRNIEATADEFFRAPVNEIAAQFPGQTYWVARHGLRVSWQTEGQEIGGFEFATIEVARAEFANETYDVSAGAPMPGDKIKVLYGKGEDKTFTVESVTRTDDTHHVTADGRILDLVIGQYRIGSRPAAL